MSLGRPIRAPIARPLGEAFSRGGLPWDVHGGGRALTTEYIASLFDQHYSEPRNAGNTINTGKIQTQKDLSAGGHDLVSASAGVRPAQTASDMLGGAFTGVYDGVDDYLSVASITRPKTYMILYRMPVYNSGQPILGYGAGAYPYLEKGDITGNVAIFGTAAAKAQAAANIVAPSYFYAIVATDDGSDPVCTVYKSDFSGVLATATVHDVAGRSGSPGQFSVAALTGGTFPTTHEHAALGVSSSLLSASQIASVLAYWKATFYNQALPRTPWVGTKSTNSDAQPGPYPTAHDGVSGDTIALWAARLVGTWGGGGTATIGGADDPGVGNRGAIEALLNAGNRSLVAVPIIGTADSAGVISTAAMVLAIRRAFAIAALYGGTPIANWYLCTIAPLATTPVGAYTQANIDTYNAAVDSMVTTLQGFGLAVTKMDFASGCVTGTDYLPDNLHFNLVGAKSRGLFVKNKLIADGFYGSTKSLWLSGHSHVAGGSNLTPQATAQFRPWLAQYLAAAGG